MAEQYFAADPSVGHDEQIIQYRIGETSLRLTTDRGVFSRQRVDYGSGVLLEQMATLTFPAAGILDVGCGYGPLGLFAASWWPKQTVDLVDVNHRSLALAQKNVELNGIQNVNIYESDAYEQIPASRQFGLIVTNPPIRAGKQVVTRILHDSHHFLVAGGSLLVVIQKKQGEPSARRELLATFGQCEILARDKGYYILQAVKSAE